MSKNNDKTRQQATLIAEALVRMISLVTNNVQGLMTLLGYVVLSIVNGKAKNQNQDAGEELRNFTQYLLDIYKEESQMAKKVDINAN